MPLLGTKRKLLTNEKILNFSWQKEGMHEYSSKTSQELLTREC
jgi:hypothetical protein